MLLIFVHLLFQMQRNLRILLPEFHYIDNDIYFLDIVPSKALTKRSAPYMHTNNHYYDNKAFSTINAYICIQIPVGLDIVASERSERSSY